MVLVNRLDELWLVHLKLVGIREHDDRVLPLERIQEFPQLVVCWRHVSPGPRRVPSIDIPLSANTSALFAVSLTRGRCASSTFSICATLPFFAHDAVTDSTSGLVDTCPITSATLNRPRVDSDAIARQRFGRPQRAPSRMSAAWMFGWETKM